MRTIRHYLLLLPALIGLSALVTACNDDETPENPILRPLEQHLQGTWLLWKNYKLIDGEYVDSPFPEELLEEYDMRPGGLLVKSRNYDYSILVADTWSVDEKEALLFLGGGEPFPIYRLTADEMEIGGTKAYDVETDEWIYGDQRWVYRRIDSFSETNATKLLGKWKLLHRYEIKDKQWVETPLGQGDEGWREYHDIGTCTYYERIGSKESSIEYDNWGTLSKDYLGDFIDYGDLENVFLAYVSKQGGQYGYYDVITWNTDGTLTAYSLDFFMAGGEGVADVGRKDVLVRE